MADLFKRASSRKFIAFVATQGQLGVLAFMRPDLATESIGAMVATFAIYAGAKAAVDRALAAAGASK